jgi:hypothetical protein
MAMTLAGWGLKAKVQAAPRIAVPKGEEGERMLRDLGEDLRAELGKIALLGGLHREFPFGVNRARLSGCAQTDNREIRRSR